MNVYLELCIHSNRNVYVAEYSLEKDFSISSWGLFQRHRRWLPRSGSDVALGEIVPALEFAASSRRLESAPSTPSAAVPRADRSEIITVIKD